MCASVEGDPDLTDVKTKRLGVTRQHATDDTLRAQDRGPSSDAIPLACSPIGWGYYTLVPRPAGRRRWFRKSRCV